MRKPHPPDQRASEGEKHRIKLGRVKNRIWSIKSHLLSHLFRWQNPLGRVCVKDAVVRKNLGNFCYEDEPVLVFF